MLFRSVSQSRYAKTGGSFIASGYKNVIDGRDIGTSGGVPTDYLFIGGGTNNNITISACSSILGGHHNTIEGYESGTTFFTVADCAIVGGVTNKIQASQSNEIGGVFIGGGVGNTIYGASKLSSIVGGEGNYVHNHFCMLFNSGWSSQYNRRV